MHDQHLANTIRMLQDRRRLTTWPQSLRDRAIEVMQAELAKRGVSLRQALTTPKIGKCRQSPAQ